MLIRNGNTYRFIRADQLAKFEAKGYVAVEETGGGVSPPPAVPAKAESKEPVQHSKPSGAAEPVKVIEQNGNPRMLDGVYYNRLSVPKLREFCDEKGLSYPPNATKKEFHALIAKWLKDIPQTRDRRNGL